MNRHEPTVSEMQCPYCLKEATISFLKVDVPGEVPSVITNFDCPHCLTCESQFHEGDIGTGTGILIECTIKDADDLKRYVNLKESTKITFEKDKTIMVEYTCGRAQISNIGGILDKIVEDLSNLYNVPVDNDNITRFGEEKVCDNSTAKEQIEGLKKMRREKNFKMIIHDPTGLSRVFPKEKTMTDMEGMDLEAFNDENVKHELFENIEDEKEAKDMKKLRETKKTEQMDDNEE